MSVGAAQAFAATGSEPQALVTLADDALYRAKESGRNRVCAVDAVPAKEPPDHEPAPALHTGAESAAAESADATVMQPGESSGPANPEAAYMRTVAGKFLKLRFPADQETDYRDHDRDQRRKHLAVMGALGVVVYNVYTASSIAMFPDIQGKVRLMQAGLSAIVLFLIAASYAIALPARWREAVFSFGTALIGVVSRGEPVAEEPCGAGGVYVRADAVVPWIEKVTGRKLTRSTCDEPADGPGDGELAEDAGGCSAASNAVGAGALLGLLVLALLAAPRRTPMSFD